MSSRPSQPSGPKSTELSRPKETPRPRVCRTPGEAFTAGWEDGAHDAPLTPAERTRLVALLAPHMRPAHRQAAAAMAA